MLETNNQVNVPIKRRSYLKLILYIVISVIATAMIVCGPILMQQYNGEGSNPRNNFVC
jgi:hypothetical protein